MNEFLDRRDGGTAILSHFYLLTGCAGSLWLEGSVFDNEKLFHPLTFSLQALSSATVHGNSYTRSWRCDGRILQFIWVRLGLVHLEQASIVGKRLGTHRWSPTTSKTLEGSIAYTTSIVACACALRLCGITGDFSVSPFFAISRQISMVYLEDITLCNRGRHFVGIRSVVGPER